MENSGQCQTLKLNSEIGQTGKFHLGGMTWTEAREALRSETIVLLPIGAIEAHGPHLPLSTDVLIAEELSRRAAMALRGRHDLAVILPALIYGVSRVGVCFPGTSPIPPSSISESIVSIVSSLAGWGPRRFCIVNAHLEAAHVKAIIDGVETARRESGAAIAFPDKREAQWAARLSEEFQRGARHAVPYETSLILAARPSCVRTDLLAHLLPVWIDLPARLKAGATTFAEAGGVDGYFGDPAAASAEEGERLFTALTNMVLTAIDELPKPVRD